MKEIKRLLEKVKSGNFDNQIIPPLADALEALNLELDRISSELSAQKLLKNEAYDEIRQLKAQTEALSVQNLELKKAISHMQQYMTDTLNSI